eukprot:scaffold10229_cov116-Isochrysis_galbana.AAC.3
MRARTRICASWHPSRPSPEEYHRDIADAGGGGDSAPLLARLARRRHTRRGPPSPSPPPSAPSAPPARSHPNRQSRWRRARGPKKQGRGLVQSPGLGRTRSREKNGSAIPRRHNPPSTTPEGGG